MDGMDGVDDVDTMDGANAHANPCVDMGGAGRYAGGMDKSANHRDGGAKAGEPQTVGGFLTAALNMEDQISKGVYEEYMDRARWPAQLDEGTFTQIKKRLTTLVEDTKKHAKILQALIKEHAKTK